MPEHHTTTERPAAPQRRTLTQAEIDAAIQEWNGNIESKHAVVRYMKDHAREKDTAAWLRQEFGDDLPAFPVTVDGAAGDVSWPKVQRRIAQLIKEDRFYTQEEQDRFDNIDPIAIRETLAERGIVNGQVADPEKLDSDPFIQQVMQDVEQIAAEESSAQPAPPDLSGQPITRAGDTITIGNGEPTHEIDITVSDEEYEAILQAIPEEKVYDPTAPVYHEGDTVYLDNQEYHLLMRSQFTCCVTGLPRSWCFCCSGWCARWCGAGTSSARGSAPLPLNIPWACWKWWPRNWMRGAR